MDIAKKTIWQQAAGHDRDYSDICLKWDVILNGPGSYGPWPNCKTLLQDDEVTGKKITDLKRFSEEMESGDIVVLRMGTDKVFGVGEIIGPYEWLEDFGDIDGWELQHVRRVRWLWYGQQSFSTYDLKFGDTTQKLNSGPVTNWLQGLQIPSEALCRHLVDLPKPTASKSISVDKISEFLFDHGVASASITNLTNEIGELTRIAKWYLRSGMPSEHETVAYLVIPVLRALGWTPQRMAVEWNNVDVALFENLPRSDNSLCVVVEAKKMSKSCLTAKGQALSYAKNKHKCDRLIVTDGLRYGVYVRSENDVFDLYAYLNLTRFRDHYPIYDCKGAEDALLAMAPEWKAAKSP